MDVENVSVIATIIRAIRWFAGRESFSIYTGVYLSGIVAGSDQAKGLRISVGTGDAVIRNI